MVFERGGVALDHRAYSPQLLLSCIAVEQHEHGAISPRHTLELLECVVGAGHDLPAIRGRCLADVAGVAVTQAAAGFLFCHLSSY